MAAKITRLVDNPLAYWFDGWLNAKVYHDCKPETAGYGKKSWDELLSEEFEARGSDIVLVS